MADQPSKSDRSGSSQRISNGLVALSSAAILAIYSAGYARTRSASDRVMAAAERRRAAVEFPDQIETAISASPATSPAAAPPPPEPANAARSQPVTEPVETVAAGTPAAAATRTPATPPASRPLPAEAPVKPSAPAATSTASAPSTTEPTAATPAKAPASAASSSPAPVVSTPAAPPAASNAPAPGAPVPPPAASAPGPSATPPPTAPPAVTAAPAFPKPYAALDPSDPAFDPATPRGRFKDGTYTGWGTCRHGDIEASIVITNGRIVSARVSTCLTRYPCTPWLDPLPAQVLKRQSPNVDIVSGATDSADAFYGAVYDALFKAK